MSFFGPLPPKPEAVKESTKPKEPTVEMDSSGNPWIVTEVPGIRVSLLNQMILDGENLIKVVEEEKSKV